MRKRYLIEPEGWPCSLAACPPGPFVWEHSLCFKSGRYYTPGMIEAFCEDGEVFAAHVSNEARAVMVVQPVKVVAVFSDEERHGNGRLAGTDEDAREQG